MTCSKRRIKLIMKKIRKRKMKMKNKRIIFKMQILRNQNKKKLPLAKM